MKITRVNRKIIGNTEIQDALKDTAKAASDFNRKMDKLTELTGHDYSHIKFKHNKYNEKNNS